MILQIVNVVLSEEYRIIIGKCGSEKMNRLVLVQRNAAACRK